MKHINKYITEKLRITKKSKRTPNYDNYKLFPKDIPSLRAMIHDECKKNGNKCSLNHIDVSGLSDMTELFKHSKFNDDISQWDVSNVTNMRGMFEYSSFNQDISEWDVSKANDMSHMFQDSKFNQNISNWKINQNCRIRHMFTDCNINKNYIPKALQ